MVHQWPVVPLFGGLRTEIQPIHIDDLVEYLIRALQTNIQGEYLIGGADKINLNQFLKQAACLKKKRRLFLPVPYWLLSLSANACGHAPNAGWGPAQLRNIYHSRTYSIEKTVKDFAYSPRPLEEGLRRQT